MLDECPRDGRAAVHQRVAATLTDAIHRGDYPIGARLPNERSLAARLGVSRTTLRQALAELARNGVVRRRVGRGGGTFVREPIVERRSGALVGFTAELHRQGMEAGANIVRVAVVTAARDIAAALALDPGERVVEIVRIRSADGGPSRSSSRGAPPAGSRASRSRICPGRSTTSSASDTAVSPTGRSSASRRGSPWRRTQPASASGTEHR